MKKALALVLALVLALSMAVSAFAAVLVELTPAPAGPSDEIKVEVIDAKESETVYYTMKPGTYYIALDDQDYKDIKLSTNGIISAELVKYDPAKMNVYGMEIVFDVTKYGEPMGNGEWYTANGTTDESTDKYDLALKNAEGKCDADRAEIYGVSVRTNVNIIKVTVADNYSAAYKEGTLKIDATLDKKAVSATLTVISDVSIFEYEMVKWAAANYEDGKALVCGDKGYSDYDAYRFGYDFNDDKYDIPELRTIEDAAVISTTAFRAITGKSVAVKCEAMTVEVKNVVAGQKGVNFKHYGVDVVDADDNGKAEAIEFGFYGDQVILGDYTITVDTGYNWFTLREAFGEKVEEDDIISYYVLKNGKVVKELKVDYMVADIYEKVVLELNGSNSTLGEYQIVINVPAVEGETNPNTGAESVVGVVAALAVVSVATAAAVSLKK